ncbi:MAG: Uma2 family endonuclease [Acidobacteria bacterium]|nr:Uma2 family endonuclease [Acidobacteriota bacterium]
MKTLLTAEDLEQMPDDDLLHELDEGELVTLTFASWGHGDIQQRLIGAIRDYLKANPVGRVLPNVGFVLHRNPDTLRAPGVAFVRSGRELGPRHKAAELAPDLAVEIISPSERAGQIRRKVEQYLAAGTRTVWVIYPESRNVDVYQAGGFRVLSESGTLEEPDLLPGFSMPVRELFE